MRGATIESARNVLQQYVLGPLSGRNERLSLVTFANTASLLTESPVLCSELEIPTEFVIGGLCNLSDAVKLCKSKSFKEDKVLVLTKGLTTDSYGNTKGVTDLDTHVVLLNCTSTDIPVSFKSYFSGCMCVHNMSNESLSQLSNWVTNIDTKR